jgi:RHS repeat-associated protein
MDSATGGNVDKFGTYLRDQTTGLDYADQRYFAGTLSGRFLTADPYEASGGAGDPSSWNRYPYTRQDPINRFDPSGLADFQVTGRGLMPGNAPPGGSRDALGLVGGGGSNGGLDMAMPEVGDGEGGGGGAQGLVGPEFLATEVNKDGIEIKKIRRDNALAGFVSDLADRIKNDKTCLDFLGGGRPTEAAIAAIESLPSRVLLGEMDSSISAVAQVDLSAGADITRYIVVNSNGAFFRSDVNQPFTDLVGASGQGRALAIIHEAAHTFARAYFRHGDPLLARGSNQYANDMIRDKCRKTIGSYTGAP